MNGALCAMLIHHTNSDDFAIAGHKVSREFELVNSDLWNRLCPGIERALNFTASGIAVRMKNAIAAVRAFTSKGQLSAFAIELRSPRDQFFDAPRGIFHQYPCRFWIAKTIARIQGILQMQTDFVFVA